MKRKKTTIKMPSHGSENHPHPLVGPSPLIYCPSWSYATFTLKKWHELIGKFASHTCKNPKLYAVGIWIVAN